MPSTVKLAEYLFTRLRQLGVESVHGVPGDYNLTLLDYVEPELHWVGNCNELNAGYAADGYARIKGMGALITTFGVGELSAANAIAGAYAELAPVVHIVGTPSRQLQDTRALIHHTLNDGEYRRFAQIHAQITVAQASLRDPRTCPQQIDAVLQQCLIHSRPVYIELPMDMVATPVSADGLQSEIKIPPVVPSIDEEDVIASVLDRLYASKQPMILVDGESRGYGIQDEVNSFVEATGWPTLCSAFAKSLVDERMPNFHGVWEGGIASTQDQEFIKSRDLVICFGPHFSNTNSYNYSAIPDAAITIFVTATAVKFENKVFRDLPAKYLMSNLLQRLDTSKTSKSIKPSKEPIKIDKAPEGLITQAGFYPRISDILRQGDIILAETGTAGYGCRDFKLPPNSYLFKPTTWLSIGYMLPAAQGASLAQRELHAAGKWKQEGLDLIPRTILIIGDGSFQMTVQELSTIIREKLNVMIILINNDGYTIERAIHGEKQRYNDVSMWRYLQAPALFGAIDDPKAEYPCFTYSAKTWNDLERALDGETKSSKSFLRMMEVFMERMDCPISLTKVLEHRNKK